MALRETFFRVDFEPSVATSLPMPISGRVFSRTNKQWRVPNGGHAIFARCQHLVTVEHALQRVEDSGYGSAIKETAKVLKLE